MFGVVFEKEMRDLLGSTKFIFIFAVCAVLIVTTFYVGARNYQIAQSHYEASKSENMRQLEGLTNWLQVEQHRIFMKPQPLMSLVSGVSNDIGRTIEVSGRGEPSSNGSIYNEDPIYAVFRFLDLEFIFQVILSLFAVLLGYDAVSGEKERGTLRLTFANSVSRASYIGGKLIGSFVLLSISLLLAIVVGCLFLPLMAIPMSSADWIKLALIVLTGLLYFGVFLAISVFVSTITKRTSSSFMILLVVWIMAVLVVPRASILMAGRTVAVPSVDQIASQKGSYSIELWKDFRDAMADFDPEDKTDVEAMMASLNSFMDSLSTERETKLMEFSARLNEDRTNRQAQQQAVSFALARLSPTTSLSLATTRLAGTSLDLKRRFHEQAMAYQDVYGDFMFEKTGINPGAGFKMIVINDGEEQTYIDPTELPVFEFQPQELDEAVSAAVVDIGILGLFNLIFFAGAFFSFARYDLR